MKVLRTTPSALSVLLATQQPPTPSLSVVRLLQLDLHKLSNTATADLISFRTSEPQKRTHSNDKIGYPLRNAFDRAEAIVAAV